MAYLHDFNHISSIIQPNLNWFVGFGNQQQNDNNQTSSAFPHVQLLDAWWTSPEPINRTDRTSQWHFNE